MNKIKITDNITMVDEGHLGGFIIENDPATYMPNLWEFLCKKIKANSVIDIGCGMGYAIEIFLKHCKDVTGIDGSKYVLENSKFKNNIISHDFSSGKINSDKIYDLAWSCEFLEHVEEKYMENYFPIFKNSKYVAVTYAGLNQDGHHHVNCKESDYWIDKFKENDLIYCHKSTMILRKKAMEDALQYNKQYNDNHFTNRGLFFYNKKYQINEN